MAKDPHYGIPGHFGINRCAECSLMFLDPMYSDEELSKLYPADYYAYQASFDCPRWKAVTKKIIGFQFGTKEPEFEIPGKMLDLGCGTGWFLAEKRKSGWDIEGVEISENAARIGREHGVPIFAGAIAEANFPEGSFDYVRANHSFEHIACPNSTLDEIHRVLKADGKLLIGVPNIDSLTARIFRQYWWHLAAPVHAFSYSKDTLSLMLRKHGFDIERVTFNSDFAGILGSIQIWLNRKSGKKSSEGLLMKVLPLKILCHWIAKCVDFWGFGDVVEITARKRRMSA